MCKTVWVSGIIYQAVSSFKQAYLSRLYNVAMVQSDFTLVPSVSWSNTGMAIFCVSWLNTVKYVDRIPTYIEWDLWTRITVPARGRHHASQFCAIDCWLWSANKDIRLPPPAGTMTDQWHWTILMTNESEDVEPGSSGNPDETVQNCPPSPKTTKMTRTTKTTRICNENNDLSFSLRIDDNFYFRWNSYIYSYVKIMYVCT